MRIIGGTHKRKTILAVPGMTTRPSSDRLRESLFNILGDRVPSARVLDLFAGTGALGLEALSRGAASCVFIDHQKQALEVIRKNIRACAMENRSRVVLWDIARNLNTICGHLPAFNLVFMDPPYGKGLIGITLHHLLQSQSLEEGACLVCEHARTDMLETLPMGLSLTDHRRYGKTGLSFFTVDGPVAGHDSGG